MSTPSPPQAHGLLALLLAGVMLSVDEPDKKRQTADQVLSRSVVNERRNWDSL
jgi:hypothetical protein